jgi:hypothetical protein
MRRVVLTIVLLFYSLSVVARAVERTETWAAERIHKYRHHRTATGPGIAESVKHFPHQVQTKLLEDGWVLLAPAIQCSYPVHCETILHHWLTGLVTGLDSPTFAPRAPPTSLR